MIDLSLTPLDPARDAAMIHDWVTQERAKFWGMGDHSLDEVREVYEFVDGLTTHHAYLVLWQDVPVALFQTYEPAADPVGEFYDVQDGDFGIHLMTAPATTPTSGFTSDLFGFLADHIFSEPLHRRIIVEPDARNAKAISRFRGLGFEPGPRVELAQKPAQIGFLTRERWEGRFRTTLST